MQVGCNRQFCLGLAMDSNDNLTGNVLQSRPATRTWKDFSPPTSVRSDSLTTMAESGNANSKALPGFHNKEIDGDTADCLDSGISSVGHGIGSGGNATSVGNRQGNVDTGTGNVGTGNVMKLEQKVQVLDGPVIRMGTGALTSRRDARNQPDSLPTKTQPVQMATWKDVSPPKEKRHFGDLSSSSQQSDDPKSEDMSCEEKNRNPIRTNPFHESTGIYRGTDGSFQSVKRIKTDAGDICAGDLKLLALHLARASLSQEANTAVALTTWRDVSPTKGQGDGRKKRPESGYFSNDVQSEGGQESREEIDTSLSDSECGRKERSASLPGEEACFHSSDYFYEDEFSVQFDTNLRDAAADEQGAADEEIILPQSLNGSYTKFGGLRDSLLQMDMYLGPYESELSGSRTSMEISSSEREMMCSSDMLNLSNDPLFTPTPPPVEHQQNLSVDSLSHNGHSHPPDMGNSRSSNDANLAVDCCIRKDAYFLSFNGSQEHRSTSESEISFVSQTSSQEGQQDGSRSDSSHAEDECSGSFHDQEDRQGQKPSQNAPPPTVQYRPVRNMLLSRYPGRICLEALQEYLLDRSHSTKSPGSSRHSCSSHCKLSPLCGTLMSSGDVFGSDGMRRGLRRSSNLTTWKQVKNLRKLGKEPNLHERSRSLPDLTADDVKVVRREQVARTVESMAESFHTKRHSAYILELYQQLLASSNPPSPTTLSRIDQILFHEHKVQADSTTRQDVRRPDCENCPSCGTQERRNFHLNLRQDAQCGRSQTAADTEISPHTLTLWYGQKNFSSQFPPNTADCGVQTSATEQDSPALNHRSMQTSPASPGADLLHMLNELQSREASEARESSDVGDLRTSHDSRAARNQQREKPAMPRAKSAMECRDTQAERLKTQMRRTVSLSPSRIGMNSFYTHQSLPDLSFLSGSSRHLSKSRESSTSAVSLFDPVQIPIVLTPVMEDGSRSSQCQTRSSASSGCGCVRDGPHQSRHHRRRRSSSGKSDLTSSGSNYSLSSSSGIDPGYIEPRAHTCLPPELEHLLFLPPHLESAYHQLGIPETNRSQNICQNAGETSKSESGTGDEEQKSPTKQAARIDRYANEAYPGCAHTQGVGVARNVKQGRRESNCSSTGSLTIDRLGALKEEKTPSPEPSYCHYPPRDYTDHRCFGCHSCSEGESSQELDEEKFQMYQRWLQERKPPLKSCLRKRYDRDHKTRSLSCDAARDEPPEKPPRRPNRHSIACDGMFPVLVDEDGFECQQPPPPPERAAHIPQHPPPDLVTEKVVLRRKKQAPAPSDPPVEGMSQEEINRAKRVSFASEVSFHSPNYTPQSSPRRQPAEGDITAVEMEDDILTLHVVRRGKTLHTAPGEHGTVTSVPLPASASASPSTEFLASVPATTVEISTTQSPWDQKAYTLTMVIQAGESLIGHFAQARDPFDKVRLGNAQETPQVGALVVTSLCPAIERVVRDGMKPFLTGLHIFGKIHASPWRMAESSAEIGPYTRTINDLVKQLKVRPNLVSHRQKFYAFLAGLLNLRLLDFWLGYVSSKENIVRRFYEDDAIVCLSRTRLEKKYQDMLLALQPLAVLPFQMDYDVVASYSLVDSSYMGESDVDPSSPKNSHLSTSPKLVVARSKSKVSGSPDRSSWCGAPDRQDGSFTRSDFSATWDWIKTATLPKARSLMSDMGLMSASRTSEIADGGESKMGPDAKQAKHAAEAEEMKLVTEVKEVEVGGSVGADGAEEGGSPTVVRRRQGMSRGAKTSRLSQDLASMGIIASRQSLSLSMSSSVAPDAQSHTAAEALPSQTVVAEATTVGEGNASEAQQAETTRPAKDDTKTSTPAGRSVEPETTSPSVERRPLPAVVMDHGSRPNVDAARQRAEDILRRMGDNPALKRRELSPRTNDNTERKGKEDQTTEQKSRDRSESSPQRIRGSSDASPGSSPKRAASGSPQRGPVINPGSPKIISAGSSPKTVHCTNTTHTVDLISQHVSKVTVQHFPEDVESGECSSAADEGGKSSLPLQSPVTAASNLTPQMLGKKEEKAYKAGKTDYTFDTQHSGNKSSEGTGVEAGQTEDVVKVKADDKRADGTSEKKAADVSEKKTEDTSNASLHESCSSSASQSQSSAASSERPSSVGSRLSGLRKLSPRGSFNIISFFDRLLLPSDKASQANNAGGKKEESEDGGQQDTGPATTTPLPQPKAPSPPPPPPAAAASSLHNKKSSRIPKAQSRPSQAAKTAKSSVSNSPSSKCDKAAQPKPGKTSSANTAGRRLPQVSLEPLPSPVDTSSATTPEFDINANSPDYHLQQQQQPVFVEHNPVATSQSETSSSGSNAQSDESMEDDRS